MDLVRGKSNLDMLIATAKTTTYGTVAIQFLEDVKRLSAVSTYLSSFVDGISNYTKEDGFLTRRANAAHITSTGRFSGRNPNMQNMPTRWYVSSEACLCISMARAVKY